MGRQRRRLTDAEREERRRQDRERLEAALAELLTSEGWKRWLRARSVLHTYSFHNTLLIAHQCAARGIEPTYVAGFKAWLRLDRCVKRGERGIAVWAPMRVKERDEHGEDTGERRTLFRITHVFDTLSRDWRERVLADGVGRFAVRGRRAWASGLGGVGPVGAGVAESAAVASAALRWIGMTPDGALAHPRARPARSQLPPGVVPPWATDVD